MRIVVGFLFACHGAQKLFGMSGGMADHALSPLIVASGIIEFGGGILVMIGLFTNAAAFVSSGEMAVAYFMRHASNGFPPIVNKGELAIFYCFVFLYSASRGSGRFGVDALIKRRKG